MSVVFMIGIIALLINYRMPVEESVKTVTDGAAGMTGVVLTISLA